MADAYEQLKSGAFLYNPWMQLAMGIAGGNSGVNKTEALANAMSGGLNAAQRAQQNRYQVAEEQRRQGEYDRQLQEDEQFREFATSMASQNPNDPFWKAAVINPKWGLEYYKAKNNADYQQGSLDVDRMRAALYARSLAQYGGGGSGVGSRSVGWVPDTDMSDTQFKTIDGLLSHRYGESWDSLGGKQKRAFAAIAINEIRRGAKQGQSVGDVALPPLPPREERWYETLWNKGVELVTPKMTKKDISVRDAATNNDVVTDSNGRKWKYKGSGDPTKKENFIEVK